MYKKNLFTLFLPFRSYAWHTVHGTWTMYQALVLKKKKLKTWTRKHISSEPESRSYRDSLLSNHSLIYKPWTAREQQEVKNRDHGGVCVQNRGEGKSLIYVFVCSVFEALFMKMKLL